MKKIVVFFCFGILLLFIISCKKETRVVSISIEGSWELRQTNGMLSITYPPGNGHIIKFNSGNYERSLNGQITQSGRYRIVQDTTVSSATCLVIPAGQYTHRIIYDNNMASEKVFIEFSANKLTFLSGCFAYDAGSFADYARQ
ncbi:MAG: hypothetical protein WDO71_04200 [Bacteroidota bacterium]